MASCTVHVTTFYGRDEPDGSSCLACGDKCYLQMWRLFARINGGEPRPIESVLCDSCHRALMEGDE